MAEEVNRTSAQKDTKKVIIVGDGSVGKTCLANTFVHKNFPEDYTPTVFDNFYKDMVIDNQVKYDKYLSTFMYLKAY